MKNNHPSTTRSLREYVWLALKGMGMGAADVVPGVSGGTVAFISGIYEELIESIQSINPVAVKILLKQGISAFWKHINGTFLVVLLAGIGFSILTLAKVISYALQEYPIIIWSFFFGMILSSTWFVAKKITKVNVPVVIAFIVSTAVAYYITIATPTQTPDAIWFIFLSGFIAICAMILPGISGSFILLLMGKYHFILNAVKSFDVKNLVVFILGCGVGIISFAQVISWLFKKFHNATLALLTGFMVGSLNKVWPWKVVTEYRINSKGEMVPFLERSVTYREYEMATGETGTLLYALLFMALGVVLIVFFENLASRKTLSA
jgi:putative membrane protein